VVCLGIISGINLKKIFGKISSVKTQIIQLEIHDDTISVKDKMDWSQTPRVLLVWPERGKVFRNRIDLVLLERHCSAHGSQLALLTKDLEVKSQAEEAGIPVFQSRKTAQLQPWRKSFREFRRRDLEQQAAEPRDFDFFDREKKPQLKDIPVWGRISIFTIGVLAVLVIAGLLLPSAEVTVHEEETWMHIVIPVVADPEAREINISGIIPSREIAVLLEGEDSRTASGQIPIPNDYARGEVIFTNLTQDSLIIPMNTILSTGSDDPILFITLLPGNTPAGKGEQTSIRIQALEGGTSGNVDASQITRINQAFGADLSVDNPEPTSGGTDLYIPSPNQKDREKLSLSLSKKLRNIALDQIQGQLTSEDIMLSSDLAQEEIIQEEFSPLAGFSGNTLTLTRKARFYLAYISGEDLKTLALKAINARYVGNEIEPILDSVALTNLSSPVPRSDQSYGWDLGVRWREIRVMPDHEVIQLVLGKKIADAEFLLQESLDLKYPPVIKLSPKWWLRLPALPFRIDIFQEGG